MMQDDREAGRVLRERAARLARTPAPENAGESLEVLEFGLASERYAIETRYLEAVHPLRDLTPLPGAPPFVPGIVNLRGRILPVIDMKKFFDLPEQGITDLHRVILVRGHDLVIGLLADVVFGLRRIPTDRLQDSLPTLNGIRGEYLLGVTDERTVVLHLQRILTDPKFAGDRTGI